MQLKGETMKRIKYIGLGFALASSTLLLSSLAGAQATSSAPDQSSLGDYARKVRKDPAAAKAKPKVFDNDNLPVDDKLSIVGPPPAANEAGDKSAAATDSKDKDKDKAAAPNPAAPAQDEQAKKQAAWKAWQDKLTAQKDAIDLA